MVGRSLFYRSLIWSITLHCDVVGNKLFSVMIFCHDRNSLNANEITFNWNKFEIKWLKYFLSQMKFIFLQIKKEVVMGEYYFSMNEICSCMYHFLLPILPFIVFFMLKYCIYDLFYYMLPISSYIWNIEFHSCK